jgi:ATP-dependent RNA/DNA helicase IGHMBP2
MLTIQYRMNEAIMNWSSKEFYQGKLIADRSVKDHLLKDLSNIVRRENIEEIADENLSQCPLFLIDTTGYDMPESTFDDESSRANEGEVVLVQTHVKELIENYGVSIDQIGVITPYNMQVQMLRQKLLPIYPQLEIKSVDGFQGREKEVIIISMVRSNLHGQFVLIRTEKVRRLFAFLFSGEVGFLSDSRRINVAITRARRHLCIIANVQTVSHDPFIKRLIDYMLENGRVHSAFEFISEDQFFLGDETQKKTKNVTKKATHRVVKEQKSTKTTVEQRSEATLTLETVLTNILDQRIDAFLKDSNQNELQFEDGLSPFGRRYVHQVRR